MLSEIKKARQVPGEPYRRWFMDDYFDLIIWQDSAAEIIAFQLCYNKGPEERALTWRRETGFTHRGVDDGEHRDGYHKMTPILIPDGEFDRDPIRIRFLNESRQIDPTARDFIIGKLNEYRL